MKLFTLLIILTTCLFSNEFIKKSSETFTLESMFKASNKKVDNNSCSKESIKVELIQCSNKTLKKGKSNEKRTK